MLEKRQKTCSSCETKYTVEWDIEVQDLEPLTCPFCGHEVEELEDDEEDTIWTNESEDDNWN
jgi:transcription initiation factor IIE alpha subunit